MCYIDYPYYKPYYDIKDFKPPSWYKQNPIDEYNKRFEEHKEKLKANLLRSPIDEKAELERKIEILELKLKVKELEKQLEELC